MADAWYYQSGGKSAGPLTFAHLQQLAADGQIYPTDKISSDGQTSRAAWEVAQLKFGSAVTAVVTPGAPVDKAPIVRPFQSNYEVSPAKADILRKSGFWAWIVGIYFLFCIGLTITVWMTLLLMIDPSTMKNGKQLSELLGSSQVTTSIIVAVVELIPVMLLIRFAIRARRAGRTRNDVDVEIAMHAQLMLWRFLGLMILLATASVIAIGLGVGFWAQLMRYGNVK